MSTRAWAMAMLLALAGCAQPHNDIAFSSITRETAERGLDARTYKAVDAMLEAAPELLTGRGPMVVGSVEDIHDVNSSTPFGNIISEMVRSRLVQRGIPVTEVRVRSSMLLDRTKGELVLSRDRRALMAAPVAANIATGTYAVASGKIYVSLKIVTASDARIVAASDFVTERTPDVNELLLLDPYSR